MDGTHRFGNLRKAYIVGRRDYPRECIDYIVTLANGKVLDLGCGTGIATRQLANAGLEVIGADSDERMLREARKTPGISYIHSRADNLPFEDSEFDAVTAFGAFHWFCDKSSIAEIKRVLSENGVLITVNKNESESDKFRETYLNVLSQFANTPESVKNEYDPEKILKREGFSDVTKVVFPLVESYSVNDAIINVQSRGVWNYIPERLYEKVVGSLRKGLSQIAIGGKVNHVLNIAVVHGKK